MQVIPNTPQHIVVVQGSQAPVRPPRDPTDQIRAYKVLGGIHIIIGLLFILFQVIYDVLISTSGDGYSNNGYSGYWFGIIVLMTGVSAIEAIRKKSKGCIICFLTLSVLNFILGISVMSVNLAAGYDQEYKGLTDAIAACAGIEGFIIAVISAGFGCGGLGACVCCDKPPLYKDNSPPAPNYQAGQAAVIQGQPGQYSLVQGQSGQQILIQGAGGQTVVQGQQTIIQGQPMVVQGQSGVQFIQQPGYPQNIQPQGYMAPPPQYPQNVPPLQGNMVAPPPYQPHIQPHTVPSAPPDPRYVTQNQAQGRDALVYKRNAQDYELPTTPDEENREHPFLKQGNREHVRENQVCEEIPAERLGGTGDPDYLEPIGDHNEYEHPDEDKYEKPDQRGRNKKQSKEERYVPLGKKGKKYQGNQTEEDKYEKPDRKEKKDKTYDKLKKK